MNPRRSLALTAVVSLLLWQLPLEAVARIKLITQPVRERVELRLSESGSTLVEEERIVPLLAGRNAIDFAWGNTPLQPQTLLFRITPEPADSQQINLLSVSYPPNENAVVWNLSAQQAGSARVRISYLMGGVEAHYSYKATADAQERHLQLDQYLEVVNRSGESFGDITLWPVTGGSMATRLQEDESKKLLQVSQQGVAIEKRYSVDVSRQGYLDQAQGKLKVPLAYHLLNSRSSGLGQGALPAGKVRVYLAEGAGGEAFMGEDRIASVPLDEPLDIELGLARDIVVKRQIEQNHRERVAGDLYTQQLTLLFEVENFKQQSLSLDIAESLRHLAGELGLPSHRPIEWQIEPASDIKLQHLVADESSADRLLFRLEIPARKASEASHKAAYRLRITLKNLW